MEGRSLERSRVTQNKKPVPTHSLAANVGTGRALVI